MKEMIERVETDRIPLYNKVYVSAQAEMLYMYVVIWIRRNLKTDLTKPVNVAQLVRWEEIARNERVVDNVSDPMPLVKFETKTR